MIELGVIISIVIALSEIVKHMGFPVRFIPVINILLGIIAMFIWNEDHWKTNLLNGLIAGLTASGLFSGAKNMYIQVTEKDKEE